MLCFDTRSSHFSGKILNNFEWIVMKTCSFSTSSSDVLLCFITKNQQQLQLHFLISAY